MNGIGHARSGIVAGAALGAAGVYQGWLTPLEAAAFAAVVPGAALLPDLDMATASMAGIFGAPSRLFTAAVLVPFFGGHRHGSHRWIFSPLLFSAAAVAAVVWPHPILCGVVTGLVVGMTMVGLRTAGLIPSNGLTRLIAACASGWGYIDSGGCRVGGSRQVFGRGA